MNNRFIILADAHLGLEGLQSDGLSYGDAGALLPRAITKVLELDPKQVILLGDLVNRGYDPEYQRALEVLGPIWDRCVPILGNHELQRASIADFERQMKTRAFRTEVVCGLPSIILNSGIENLPDSEWHGALSDEQLRFIDETLIDERPGPLLVFVHHPIAGTVRDSEKPMHALINSAELASRLQRAGRRVVVFSAHTHSQSYFLDGSIACVGAPPLGFWPHAMVVVDVEDEILRFHTIPLLAHPELSPDARAGDASYRAAREGGSGDRSGITSLRH